MNGAGVAVLYPQTGIAASARRVRALIRRHAYLLLKSWPRLVSMAYYPTVTMILWGFVTIYLQPTNRFLQDAPGFFLGAVLLWDVLFRGQLGVSLTFIEELYARNLGNLFVSPLRYYELIIGQLALSVLRTLIGVGGACCCRWGSEGADRAKRGKPEGRGSERGEAKPRKARRARPRAIDARPTRRPATRCAI